jgi:hypothetical protein
MHRRSIAMLIAVGAVLASLALASVANAGGQPFTTVLEGENEVPIAGDPDATGTATVTLNRGTGEVCWDISISGITFPATAAHIHPGAAGVANPPIITLGTPTNGTSIGCVTADRVLVKEIAKNPADYYVNVHNEEFPGGAARGQLG